MPENIETPAAVLDPATNNAAVARKLAEQDAAGHSTAGTPGEFEDVGSALDKLAAAVKPSEVVQPEPGKETPVTPTPEEAAAKAAAEQAAQEKAAADTKAAEEKAAADRKAEETFKDVPPLPEGTSAKAKDSFSALKVKAAQDISERDAKIDTLSKKLSELEEAAKNPSTEQLEKDKELERLRAHLAKMDVEFDPKFKEYDSKVRSIEEFVYAELKKSPVVSDDVIAEIKKFGGLANVNLSKLFEAMKDPTTQRIVESKIADVRMLQHEKETALKTTKENVTQYMQERSKAFQEATTAHTKATETMLHQMLSKLEWTKPKDAATAATDSDKAAAQAHNAEVDRIQKDVADALQDDSPQMRAILLTGYAQMCHLQDNVKSLSTERDALKKQLTEATDKLSRIRQSSTSRLRESAAPSDGRLPAPKPADQFNTPAGDALDRIAKQVVEARTAAGR